MPELPVFQDPALLRQALTHRSYVNEHPEAGADNQRLEFLGDAVLGFLVGEMLYRAYPTLPEGQLTPLRSRLVDEKQLALLAMHLGLGDRLLLGRGAERDGGRQSPSLLSDTFEALLGAYFLDSGIEAVRQFVDPYFAAIAAEILAPSTTAAARPLVDPKSLLQQWSLTHTGKIPEYMILEASGPDHAKQFIAGVSVQGRVYRGGQGRNKKAAEQQAAAAALAALNLNPDHPPS